MPVTHRVLTVGMCAFLFTMDVSQAAEVPPDAARASPAARIQAVETCLPDPVMVKGELRACHTLAERMRALDIPGLSVAVIHDGAVE